MGIAPFDPTQPREKTISVDETARRLQICVGSVLRLIREGILPAKQLMPSAPWQVPVAALDSESVKIGVRAVVERRPRNFRRFAGRKDTEAAWLPIGEMHYETRSREFLGAIP